MASFGTITVQEVKAKQEAGEKFRLIDVREPSEHNICRIQGAELKPLGQIMQWMQELAPEEEIVLHCHHGMRSEQASNFLARQGYTNVKNMIGGIDEWAAKVDPSVPRY